MIHDLVKFEIRLDSDLEHFGTGWIRLGQVRSDWVRLDHAWSKLDQAWCQNWSVQVR